MGKVNLKENRVRYQQPQRARNSLMPASSIAWSDRAGNLLTRADGKVMVVIFKNGIEVHLVPQTLKTRTRFCLPLR